MTRQEMKEFAQSQVTWHENQNKWLMDRIERINNRLKQTRKEDKEQKEFAQIYEGGKYAHMYEGNYQGDETRKLINERRRHQREIKKNTAAIERYKREVEKYTDPADAPQEAPQEAPAAEAEQQPTETENAPQAAPSARQDDTAAAILGAIGATAPAHTVTVTWANGTRATYSAAMLDMIRTDPAALDIQDDDTGEIIYIKPTPTEEAPQAAPQAAEGITTNEQREEENHMSTTTKPTATPEAARTLYNAITTGEAAEAHQRHTGGQLLTIYHRSTRPGVIIQASTFYRDRSGSWTATSHHNINRPEDIELHPGQYLTITKGA